MVLRKELQESMEKGLKIKQEEEIKKRIEHEMKKDKILKDCEKTFNNMIKDLKKELNQGKNGVIPKMIDTCTVDNFKQYVDNKNLKYIRVDDIDTGKKRSAFFCKQEEGCAEKYGICDEYSEICEFVDVPIYTYKYFCDSKKI